MKYLIFLSLLIIFHNSCSTILKTSAELNMPVKMIPLSDHSISVDVPLDVERVEKALRDRNLL